jgi:preprotein translocase subunit SecD
VRTLVPHVGPKEQILVADRVEMTGEEIDRAYVTRPGRSQAISPSVGLRFTSRGGQQFAQLTGENVGKRLAIILNTRRDADGKIAEPGTCYSAPVIRAAVFGDAVIEAGFSLEEARNLSAVLDGGCLPVSVHVEGQSPVVRPAGPVFSGTGIAALAAGLLIAVASLAGAVWSFRAPTPAQRDAPPQPSD